MLCIFSNIMKRIKIVFTGGGTGGHLLPVISIARELRRLPGGQNIKCYYIGPSDELGNILLSQENFKIYHIAAGKIRRYFSFQNIIDALFTIPFGVVQSFFLMLWIRPKLVFSKGGAGSAAVVIAASSLGFPLFLHESDTVPGLSNRAAYKEAKKIFISFAKTEFFDLQNTTLVGNPIAKELLGGSKEQAQELFGVTLQKPVLLFLGGSQGAEAINDFVLSIANEALAKHEIIHVCGKKNYKQVSAEADVIVNKDFEPYYHLRDFLHTGELKSAYAAADLIISRAGAGSIFEIAAAGIPSILVPLPSAAGDHQSKNAYEYAKTGAAIVIEQENLNPNFVLAKIDYLMEHPEELEKMKKGALSFARPQAAEMIAQEILDYVK